MASPACHKPPALPAIPRPRQRPQHYYSNLFPIVPPAAQQAEALPLSSVSHSFLIFPHSASASGLLFRNVFEDAVYDGAALPATTVSPAVACSPQTAQDHGLADDSAPSCFSSSSDLCMSSSSDIDEDDTGSSSTSLRSEFESEGAQEGPLDSLASLCAALPIKRGLSRYFSGKSQSFSTLAHVSSVADLAKPENRYVKRRRTARLGVDSMLKNRLYPPRCRSAGTGISKKIGSCNRYKVLKSVSRPEGAAHDGVAKCFSVPEF